MAALLVCMGALCDSGETGPASASILHFCRSERSRISSGAAPLCLYMPAIAGRGWTLGLRGGKTDIDALLQSLYDERDQQKTEEQKQEDDEVIQERRERDSPPPQRVWDKDEDKDEDEDVYLRPDTLTSTTQFRGAREKGRRFLNPKTLQVDSSSLHPSRLPPPTFMHGRGETSQQMRILVCTTSLSATGAK